MYVKFKRYLRYIFFEFLHNVFLFILEWPGTHVYSHLGIHLKVKAAFEKKCHLQICHD